MDLLLTAAGLVLIIEGIPWFLSPQGMKGFFLRLLSIPDSTLRVVALATMLAGLLLVHGGRA